ncbi:EAL and HDOD domain-containing protein [Rugamonas sp. DEMB1]|uniref:EAL and HDOD domain-containing protein n=1 Tax=Rugamonas sp. DEMB1 TaxID=3039386 RepID=UPI00244A2F7C|nr:HDOD domain-containing protein [Rugamonas sp. DEMB1]WGG52174.1 HDOD domain-containing protein [Rugamonas sp. DEMB1]
MTASTAVPPLFLQLLADRDGGPGALLFGSGIAAASGADADAAAAQLAALPVAQLGALAARWPCFYRAQSAAALAAPLPEALEQAGWKPLEEAALHRADAVFDTQLAPAVRWVTGDWHLAPPPKPVGNQAASRALALQLVQKVAAEADTHEIETLLRHDPTLSYHLLKLVNSLGMGTGRRVTSFSQAILILGRQQLRRWLNLMLFSSRSGDMRSAMLLAQVAVRARALELLARAAGMDKHSQEQGFMVGMFSLLGTLFGLPLAEVLRPLPIGDAVQQALLEHQGELGALLALLERAEAGDFAGLAAGLAAAQIEAADFNRIVADANLWMLDVTADGAAPNHA